VSTIALSWTVANRATLIAAGYDLQRIEYDSGSGFSAIITSDDLMPLVAHVETYVYHHSGGDTSDDYQVVFVKSSDGTEYGTPQAITSKTAEGIIAVSDIRDEGYTEALYPALTDAVVQNGIDLATRYIEKRTRQWFSPRYRKLRFDGPAADRLQLQHPVIAVLKIEVEDSDQDLTEIAVYNRHLTQGLTDPDDRYNPMLWYDPEWYLTDETGYERDIYGPADFTWGGQNVEVYGIFGWTELGLAEQAQELAANSQVPASYGSAPEIIQWACKRLTIAHMFPMDDPDGQSLSTNRHVTQRKTRDQSITLDRPDAGVGYESFTADEAVDAILAEFQQQIAFEVV